MVCNKMEAQVRFWVQFLKKQDSRSGPKSVVRKHRLTFSSPLVLVFFFRKLFSKNP
jgi:hypothetical protein